jgi:hypothetical protein
LPAPRAGGYPVPCGGSTPRSGAVSQRGGADMGSEGAAMARQEAVGHSIYVFTASAGPGWGKVPNCIIDCHGRPAITKPDFDLPQGVNVRFYVSRGAFLIAGEQVANGVYYVDAVDDIARRKVKDVELVYAPRKCPDYVLSKQHKAHGGLNIGRYDHVSYDHVKRYLDATPEVAGKNDIVTIRNRAGWADPTLSEVIKALWQNGYKYADIRCCFCRGGVGDMVKDMFGRGKNELPGGTPWSG